MHRLGASLFIHNGLKYDYCLKESIESVLELCDEVVVLEAESDDGTLDFLHKMSVDNPKLKVFDHGIWECAPHFSRLAILANQARELLTSEWHFMIQADEVLHESSFPIIRRAIREDEGFDTFRCSRINLFRDFNHYVRFDSDRKPCNDVIVRLARQNIEAYGDAESLMPSNVSDKHVSNILLFHYGMVRKKDCLLEKSIAMQSWFFEDRGVDPQLVEMKAKYGEVRPEEILPNSELAELEWAHPKFTSRWVKERETGSLE